MTNNIAIDLIKLHEGFKQHPYKCTAGKLTIGYGLNLEDRGINKNEAEYILFNIVDEIIPKLRDFIKNFYALDHIRQAVLIDMVYNLGFTGFLKFKSMIKLIEEGEYEKAAEEMLNSKWAEQVPNRARELSIIFKTGKLL